MSFTEYSVFRDRNASVKRSPLRSPSAGCSMGGLRWLCTGLVRQGSGSTCLYLGAQLKRCLSHSFKPTFHQSCCTHALNISLLGDFNQVDLVALQH